MNITEGGREGVRERERGRESEKGIIGEKEGDIIGIKQFIFTPYDDATYQPNGYPSLLLSRPTLNYCSDLHTFEYERMYQRMCAGIHTWDNNRGGRGVNELGWWW